MTSGFFHESVSPFPLISCRAVSSVYKNFAGVNDTGDKLFPDVNDTGDETLATKLACHSEHEVKNHYMSVKSNPTAFQKNMETLHISTNFNLSPVSITTGDYLYFRISLRIFVKFEMAPLVY